MAEQLLQYTRQLELRILQMEEERNGQSGSVNRQPQQQRPRPPHPPPYNAVHNQRAVELGIRSDEASLNQDDDQLAHSRPEAVTRALRVLQVRIHVFDLPPFRFLIKKFTRSENFWSHPWA